MKDKIITVEPGVARLLAEASRFLSGQGIPHFLVGGFVRDMLLCRPTKDIDIAVRARRLVDGTWLTDRDARTFRLTAPFAAGWDRGWGFLWGS